MVRWFGLGLVLGEGGRGRGGREEGNSRKPISTLHRIPQDPLGQLVVKVVKRQAKETHHLLLLLLLLVPPSSLGFSPYHSLDQVPRRVRRIHALGHKSQILTLLAGGLPGGEVRAQVREHEERLFLHIPIPSAIRTSPSTVLAGAAPARLELLVHQPLDLRGRPACPAGEVDVDVVGEVGRAEHAGQGGRDKGGGGLGLDERDAEGPGEGEAVLDFGAEVGGPPV